MRLFIFNILFVIFIKNNVALTAPTSDKWENITVQFENFVLPEPQQSGFFFYKTIFTPKITQSKDVTLLYSLGSRVAGDSRVAYRTGNFSFAEPRNIRLTITYPSSTVSDPAIVSAVNVLVEQSNNNGKAYVIDGGIGQKYICFVIESYETTFLNFDSYIYGYYDK